MSRHLKKLCYSNCNVKVTCGSEASAAATSGSSKVSPSDTTPNITNNIDFKSSQILGSVKAIYLLVSSNLSATGEQPVPADSPSASHNTDECSLFKFKLELKAFLAEIIDYLRVQMVEMNSFLTDQSRSDTANNSGHEEETSGNENSKDIESSKFLDGFS